jgi:hypothetical protein
MKRSPEEKKKYRCWFHVAVTATLTRAKAMVVDLERERKGGRCLENQICKVVGRVDLGRSAREV